MAWAHQFGAVGDGQADDTAALQHALDQGEGTLALSKGTYRITRPLVLDTRKRGYLGVRGDQGTARLLMAGPGAALEVIGDHQGTATPSTVQAPTWERERMPIISGIEVLGEHPDADGIQLYRTMQATIQNVLIRRCRHGVRLVERNRNFLLTASHIYDCHDTGVFFDNCNLHQVVISANHISYCKRAGIRQHDGDVHNIQITGNDIEYNSGFEGPGRELSGEIVLHAPAGVISEFTIASNTLQATLDAPGANVFILGRAEDPPSGIRLVNITGNVLGSRDKNVVIDQAAKVSITGNTIYGGQQLNVELRNSRYIAFGSNTCFSRPASYAAQTTDGILLDHCRGCSLVGNIINDCWLGTAESGGALTVRNSHEIAINACQILDPKFRGIEFTDCTRSRISECSIHEDETQRRMLEAIRVTGGQANWISNNFVGRGTQDAISTDDPESVADSNRILG